MHAKLIRIGNSQGVRIPKALIEQARLGEELDIAVHGESLVIRQARHLREGWGSAATACHEAGEDGLDDWDVTTRDDWS